MGWKVGLRARIRLRRWLKGCSIPTRQVFPGSARSLVEDGQQFGDGSAPGHLLHGGAGASRTFNDGGELQYRQRVPPGQSGENFGTVQRPGLDLDKLFEVME